MVIGLRYEDRLEGGLNFSPCKERITLLLEENEIWDIAKNTKTIPTDATPLAAFNKKNVKAKRILLDAVKDHVIPHVSRKKYAFQMWEALTKLYQSDNHNRKMALREKLKSTRMSKTNTVASYLTRVSQIRDGLGAVGETIKDEELVRTTLNGFLEKWAPFVKGVVARENLPNWERLWDDFIQEETREEALQNNQAEGGEDEENVALIGKSKERSKKGSNGGGTFEKDVSKVKCFACHKTGHYVFSVQKRRARRMHR